MSAENFRKLHHGPEILILPNAWDVGSAKIMEKAGFPAIASTSAGVANFLGYPDGESITREDMLAVVKEIAGNVAIPVTADVEAGYGPTTDDVAETVRQVIAAGVVGINLEDAEAGSLMDFGRAVERVRAARAAADDGGVPIVINARTDGYLLGGSGDEVFTDATARGNAFLEAGADCVFVPMVDEPALIEALVKEIGGPINVLAGPKSLSLAELQDLGVARVSIGSTLSRAVLAFIKRAVEELRGPGTFEFTKDAMPYPDANALFKL